MSDSNHFLIAGGGIAGLASAIAVSTCNIPSKLLERSPTFSEVGAGLQISPNAWRCLQQWGIEDSVRECASFPTAIQARDLRTGSVIGSHRLNVDTVNRYGAPYGTLLRTDLHAILFKKVKESDLIETVTGVNIRSAANAGSFVQVAYDSAQYGSGELQGLALIGADGIHSTVRHSFNPINNKPRSKQFIAYRGLIQQAALPERLRSDKVTAWLGRNIHAVSYPVRRGEFLNVVLITNEHPAMFTPPQNDMYLEEEAKRVEFATLLQQYALHHELLDLTRAIQAHGQTILGQQWKAWPLTLRTPINRASDMAQGRIALAGDAAHPMMPFLAQGAGMAIEDAMQIGLSLQQFDNDVPQAWSHYAQQRYQRNAKVQKRALRNGRIFHLGGPIATARNISLRVMAGKLMDQPWLYAGGPIAPV